MAVLTFVQNGIDYILVGDYYIPDLKLPEEHRPIGKYGRMHSDVVSKFPDCSAPFIWSKSGIQPVPSCVVTWRQLR